MIDKNPRVSNFELLRIIAMFMIVCFHYAYKGGWSFTPFTFNRYIIKAFLILGEWGVNLFMLITGYFLIGDKSKDNDAKMATDRIKPRFSDGQRGGNVYKLCSLILQSIFYTAVINLFSCFVLGHRELFSLKTMVKIAMPELFDTYWYVTAYLLIYILHPYINCMLRAMSKKMMEEFLITVLIIWCVIPTIFRPVFGTSERGFYYNRFIWLIIVYCVGAYIKLYGISRIENMKLNICVCALTFFVMNIINVLVDYIPIVLKIEIKEFEFWPPNTVLMLVLSVAFFNIFRLLEIKHFPVINVIAGTTLGVYMLHDGGLAYSIWAFMRRFFESGYILIDIFMGALIVFCIAVIIDLLRHYAFKCINQLIFK